MLSHIFDLFAADCVLQALNALPQSVKQLPGGALLPEVLQRADLVEGGVNTIVVGLAGEVQLTAVLKVSERRRGRRLASVEILLGFSRATTEWGSTRPDDPPTRHRQPGKARQQLVGAACRKSPSEISVFVVRNHTTIHFPLNGRAAKRATSKRESPCDRPAENLYKHPSGETYLTSISEEKTWMTFSYSRDPQRLTGSPTGSRPYLTQDYPY